MALTIFAGAESVFADAGSVTFTPLVDFTGVFSSMTTVVTAVVVGAITLGLGIWGTRYLFRMVLLEFGGIFQTRLA